MDGCYVAEFIMWRLASPRPFTRAISSRNATLDEDPCHTAKASLRKAEGMTLLWLPKRSPKLNPMDTLWGQGKDVISANKQYTTIDEQVDRFLGHLRSLTNQEALHTSGVLSKKFWLKAALSH